jgi:carbamoyltransferase
MNILGISAYYHDSAAALVRDGKIIAAAQEERFTRKKHDFSFPINAIQYCLKEAGIQNEGLDIIAFYDKPFQKFDRLLYTYLTYSPKGLRSFIKAMSLWLKKKLWIKDLIGTELNHDGKIIFPEHHESHAASAFFPSPFKEAAFLTMDGVGEWTTSSFGVGKNNKIKILGELKFPHSIGLLYSAFTYFTGFRVNSGEYKMMGLAPYGEPRYVDLIKEKLIDLKEDGSFKMNMKYFNYCAGLRMTNKKFARLFGGPARKPESRITRREMDIACSIQQVTEEIVLKMANHVYKVTQMDNLVLAGGVALNCVANGRILRESSFENIWIQPAAGDAGGSLGAALFAWYQYLNNTRIADQGNDKQEGSYLGPEFGKKQIEEYLESENIPYQRLANAELYTKTAELINAQKVVGWFQGRMEFGPRALGNRSILGDARSAKMQSLINRKIKFRESFRPFAPSVLLEKAENYFEIEKASPYMLVVIPVKPEIRENNSDAEGFEKLKTPKSTISAVTHVDYTSRIQTVSKDDNPKYYRLIKEFEQLSGCPVIINTSFNVRGEPIVCTPQEAYQCFMRTNMDYLVIGDYLIDKRKQDENRLNINNISEFELDYSGS